VKNSIWMKVVGAIVVTVLLGGAAAIIRNGNRITALETHIPYIRAALARIEAKP